MNATSSDQTNQQNIIVEEIKNKVLEIDALRHGNKHPENINLPLDYIEALDEITNIDRQEIEEIARSVIAKHKHIVKPTIKKKPKTKQRGINEWLINISVILVISVFIKVAFLSDEEATDKKQPSLFTRIAKVDYSGMIDTATAHLNGAVNYAVKLLPESQNSNSNQVTQSIATPTIEPLLVKDASDIPQLNPATTQVTQPMLALNSAADKSAANTVDKVAKFDDQTQELTMANIATTSVEDSSELAKIESNRINNTPLIVTNNNLEVVSNSTKTANISLNTDTNTAIMSNESDKIELLNKTKNEPQTVAKVVDVEKNTAVEIIATDTLPTQAVGLSANTNLMQSESNIASDYVSDYVSDIASDYVSDIASDTITDNVNATIAINESSVEAAQLTTNIDITPSDNEIVTDKVNDNIIDTLSANEPTIQQNEVTAISDVIPAENNIINDIETEKVNGIIAVNESSAEPAILTVNTDAIDPKTNAKTTPEATAQPSIKIVSTSTKNLNSSLDTTQDTNGLSPLVTNLGTDNGEQTPITAMVVELATKQNANNAPIQNTATIAAPTIEAGAEAKTKTETETTNKADQNGIGSLNQINALKIDSENIELDDTQTANTAIKNAQQISPATPTASTTMSEVTLEKTAEVKELIKNTDITKPLDTLITPVSQQSGASIAYAPISTAPPEFDSNRIGSEPTESATLTQAKKDNALALEETQVDTDIDELLGIETAAIGNLEQQEIKRSSNPIDMSDQLNEIIEMAELAKMSVSEFYMFNNRLPKPDDNIVLPVNYFKAHPMVNSIYLSDRSNLIVELADDFGQQKQISFVPNISAENTLIDWKCDTNIHPNLITNPAQSGCSINAATAASTDAMSTSMILK